jgi:hypothetical protein
VGIEFLAHEAADGIGELAVFGGELHGRLLNVKQLARGDWR